MGWVGAVLSHRFGEESERPIAYASRTMAPAEKRYCHLDKEALAIIFGLKKFYQYLYGRKFIIYTDHKPLSFLFDPTRAIPQLASSRLQRWALTLSAYTYSIEDKSGKRVTVMQMLSVGCHLQTPQQTFRCPQTQFFCLKS